MGNSLQSIIERLQEINRTLDSCCNGSLPFDDWYEIAQFYFEWQNTNLIIDEAERLAEENPDQLKELAGTLKEESAKIIVTL